jgi:hypothetical protein
MWLQRYDMLIPVKNIQRVELQREDEYQIVMLIDDGDGNIGEHIVFTGCEVDAEREFKSCCLAIKEASGCIKKDTEN